MTDDLQNIPEKVEGDVAAALPAVTNTSDVTRTISLAQDITLSDLPDTDQQAVREYATQINIKDTTEVLQYGSAAQEKLVVFADTALASARNKDTGAVGDTLTGLVTQLQGFGMDDKPKGIFGFLKKAGNEIATLKNRYDKVTVSVDQVAEVLENHRIDLLKDIAMLDRLYDENVEYYRQLCFYIVAGKEKIDTLTHEDLPKLRTEAQASTDPTKAQGVSDLENSIGRFERKVYDLELTRQISIQMAPQIRLLQNNDSLLADKIHSALVNTLPLWKSQMVLALGLEGSRKALAAQKAVTDATNKMLLSNAEVLKQGTIDTAREAERGIVDIETLTKTNQSLIETLDEVVAIQNDGRAKRASAEIELTKMEGALKDKLLQLRSAPPTTGQIEA